MDATNSNTGVASSYLPGRNVNGHVSNQGPTDPNILTSHFSGMNIGGMNMHGNAGPMPIATAPGFIVGSEGQFVYASMAPSQPMNFNPTHDGHYHNFHMAPGSYGAPYVGLPMPLMPFTPGRNHIPQHRLDRGHSEVPSLENRRGSYSTTESTPATPFYGAMSHREIAPRVASLDRSAYTTPSPQQIVLANAQIDQHGKSSALTRVSDQALDDMLKKSPSIPKAVPAVFTPASQMKSVEQSLENRIPGNRNVYIRGLHPTTDDELLFKFASRFGEVETSKAIIDTGTGACKGFGFAKFYNIHDSELCIRGFHRLGYEVGFARESFNSRLKAEGDDASTNLYISNLPKTLSEVELGTIFLGYTILSSKILRDSMGNSRGVGFARFEAREICDDVIRKFNGVGIGEEGLLMNIRYADTPAQKELKRITAERRQFRTNEYNIGAYGTPLVGMGPNVYNQQSQWRRSIQQSRSAFSRSSAEGGNVMSHSDFQPGQSQTATSSSADADTSTPTSSECEEGVTIHVDFGVGTVPSETLKSSPSAKEAAKKETQ